MSSRERAYKLSKDGKRESLVGLDESMFFLTTQEWKLIIILEEIEKIESKKKGISIE